MLKVKEVKRKIQVELAILEIPGDFLHQKFKFINQTSVQILVEVIVVQILGKAVILKRFRISEIMNNLVCPTTIPTVTATKATVFIKSMHRMEAINMLKME